MERIQILLELADEANTSTSNIVRELMQERFREHQRTKLRQAAQLMADEYR